MHLRRPSLLTIAAAAAATMVASCLCPTVVHAQKTAVAVDVKPFLGKDFPAYEKVLGAPKLTQAPTKDVFAELRYYKHPGFTRIVLRKAPEMVQGKFSDHLLPYVSEAQFLFPAGSIPDWKTALAKVGLSAVGVEVTPQKGYVNLKNAAAHWEGSWISKNPDSHLDDLRINPSPSAGTAEAAPAAADVHPGILASVLTQPRAEVEKLLGRRTYATRHSAGYEYPGFKQVEIMWVDDKVATMTINADTNPAWQAVLSVAGFDPTGVQLKKSLLTGVKGLPEGFTALWYKDDRTHGWTLALTQKE